MEQILSTFLTRIPGLKAIVVTDTVGIVIVQALIEGYDEHSISTQRLAAASLAVEQTEKLDIGMNKSSIAIYKDYKMVHFNDGQLMVHLIAASTTLSGYMLDLRGEIMAAVQPLRTSLPR
eukprot:m.78122 g.78122  ORF g.78122 m.78122 type:complete len:120 (-) comp16220_c0_seq4:382-741(-)